MPTAPEQTEAAAWRLPLLAGVGIAAGGVLHLSGAARAGDAAWAITTALVLVPLTLSVARSLGHGDVGVDAIALLAMAGALALGELAAGAVVALMLSGGNALEAAAGRRARRELSALLARAPRIAHRRRGDRIEEVAVEAVGPGDVVVVRGGEVLPVDGTLASARAVVDEAALTGESLPVDRARGGPLRSGTVNAGEPFDLRASLPAAQSSYAAIVRLVGAAQAQRAPFTRMADRYAAVLLPLTIALAGGAWALSGDAVRALAVLVVATPCPLILAAPVALVSGVSRAARVGVVVKGPAAIEALGRAGVVLLDKTGTLTLGTPAVERIAPANGLGGDELLRLAASVEEMSPHVVAEALVHHAEARGVALARAEDVRDAPGDGIAGTVDGRRVAVGSPRWLRAAGIPVEAPPAGPGRTVVAVALDGRPAGTIVMADRPRPDAAAAVRALRDAGVRRVVMVTGDDRVTAERIATEVGVDEVVAECTPEEKLAVLRELRDGTGETVAMVGDGVNDAPALAAADVGIAMAAGAGATVTSETADVVITVDRVDRVADALEIGRRSLGIARQSVLAGMGLSLVAMVAAALGHIPPLAGALLQEGIDVAVILNALRALRG